MPVRMVEFHPLAQRELDAAKRWYRGRSQRVLHRFMPAMDQIVQRIGIGAEQGSPYLQHFRWMQPKRFPYLLYYEIRDPLPVLIYAVAHTSRRPGYWRRRRPP